MKWTIVWIACCGVFLLGYLGYLLGRKPDGSWSWRTTWCRLIYSNCDWRWSHNEIEHLPYTIHGRWVGRYRCSRCLDWSIGAARYEERTRTLRGLDDTESA